MTVAFTASQHDYGGDDVGAYERLLVGNVEGLSWLLSRCFYVWQVTAAVSAGCDESGVDEDTCGIVSSVAVHSDESPRLLSRCFYEWQVAAALSAVDQENRPVGKPVGDGVQQFYIGDEFPESKKQGWDVLHPQVRCTAFHLYSSEESTTARKWPRRTGGRGAHGQGHIDTMPAHTPISGTPR